MAGPGEIDRDATLTVNFAMTETLDPAQNSGAAAMLAATWPVYDRLLNVSEDGQYLPMLAADWKFGADGKSLTLKLRDDVTFSDGEPFNAEAVKANIARYKRMPASSALSSSIASVSLVDEYTVKLSLTSATRSVLNALAQPAPGIMISPAALDAKDDLGTHPVGTGAWVVESFRPGEEVVYERREQGGIWDPESGQVARVVIKSAASDAAYNAVRSGQADIVSSDGDHTALQATLDSGQLVHRDVPAMTMDGLYLNPTVEPFDDVRVRQAVNYALDRESIVEALKPTTSPRVQALPENVLGFDPNLENRYAYDPAKAKQLLSEAGYTNGVDAGTVLVANWSSFSQEAQVIQSQLADVGIRIELQLHDVRQLVTYYAESNAAAKLTYITFPSLETGQILQWLYGNPLNVPGGISDSLASRIGKVDDSSVSKAAREKRAQEVHRLLTEKAYYAPILQGVPGSIFSSKVRGVETGQYLLAPYGAQDFRHVWIAQ